MTTALSLPVRRFVAVGLLLAAVTLLWMVLIAPLLQTYGDAENTIERMQPVLERTRTAAQNVGVLEAELKQLQQQRASPGGFLDGANDSIAAAQMQSRLRLEIDRIHGTVQSIQVLPPRDEGRFRRVTVRGQLLVDLAGLQRVVYDLEGSLPYLFVDDIEVQQHVAPKAEDDDVLLDVRLDVSGYLRKAS